MKPLQKYTGMQSNALSYQVYLLQRDCALDSLQNSRQNNFINDNMCARHSNSRECHMTGNAKQFIFTSSFITTSVS